MRLRCLIIWIGFLIVTLCASAQVDTISRWRLHKEKIDSLWTNVTDSSYWKAKQEHRDSVRQERKSKVESIVEKEDKAEEEKKWWQLKRGNAEEKGGIFGGRSVLTTRYTRAHGWFVRPEVYSGFALNGGWQASPNLQLGLWTGITNSLNLGAGVRVYLEDKPRTPFFDMKLALASGTNGGYFTGAMVGYSIKDIDFGAGLGLTHYVRQDADGYAIGNNKYMFVLSLGYNFRFYETTISRREYRQANRSKRK